MRKQKAKQNIKQNKNSHSVLIDVKKISVWYSTSQFLYISLSAFAFPLSLLPIPDSLASASLLALLCDYDIPEDNLELCDALHFLPAKRGKQPSLQEAFGLSVQNEKIKTNLHMLQIFPETWKMFCGKPNVFNLPLSGFKRKQLSEELREAHDHMHK